MSRRLMPPPKPAHGIGSTYLLEGPCPHIKEHGVPETPDELPNHEALMQGTETWRFMDGDKIISVNPRGRFKADNDTAPLRPSPG